MMMDRRRFIENTSKGIIVSALVSPFFTDMNSYKDVIIGHNSHKYKIDLKWGELNSNVHPVKDCHEMVQDSHGRIVMLTNHIKNNVLIYDKSGKLLEAWGNDYPGAHGLTLIDEGGEDFLYITDYERHEVIKTTIGGRVVMVLDFPKESGKYDTKDQYLPTETTIAENGDIYVSDGYGLQYIMHYNAKGELLNVFGGDGKGPEHFQNAHGITIDYRDINNPCLLISARQQNKLKRFTLDGKFIDAIALPGAYICRPVIHDKNVYLATIWSGDGSAGTGFISILDENNKLISAPGGSYPNYNDGNLEHMQQALKIFTHPHDVCIDGDENLYVAQWNSGNTYPIKLYRV